MPTGDDKEDGSEANEDRDSLVGEDEGKAFFKISSLQKLNLD